MIVNASPLIFLSRIDGISWLGNLCSERVEVPHAVVQEIVVGEDGAQVLAALGQERRIHQVDNCTVPIGILAWDLGPGETQVLAHCLAWPGALAVLDDAAARQCARSFGIPIVGTLGIVLAAKRMGWIPAARPVVERLLREGLYLSAALIAAALQEVGE